MLKYGIPETVEIRGVTHTVEIKDDVGDLTKGKELWGCIDHDTCSIRLFGNMSRDRLWATFLHEVIHGIDNADNIGINEKNTDVLSRSIYEFLKTNKINIFGD